jgi:hypothetical protein
VSDVNMDEPLPAIQSRGQSAILYALNEPYHGVRATLAHLVQVLAALPAEQLGAVVSKLDPMIAAMLDAYDSLTENEKARADRAEQALRSVAKDWRDGLAARKNGDTLAVELVQRIARMAEELEAGR